MLRVNKRACEMMVSGQEERRRNKRDELMDVDSEF